MLQVKPTHDDIEAQKINVVELDFSYYVWPQETEQSLYPSPYDIYRKHCKEKSARPPLHINCNGSIWDASQGKGHFKFMNFTKDSAVFFNLTKSLCKRLYSWEKEYKVIELCSYTIKDIRRLQQEAVTVRREANEVEHSIANCGLKQIAVLNECYSFHVLGLSPDKTNNDTTTSRNIKELCRILSSYSVTFHNCSEEGGVQILENISYLIVPEKFDNVTSSNHCGQRQYSCGDGHCISDEYVNDDIADCPDGSDEVDSILYCYTARREYDSLCEIKDGFLCICPYDKYMCDGGQCISWNRICDGKADCKEANDEMNCLPEKSTQNPLVSTFTCNDGTSIPHDLVDDFLPDCLQADDEVHLVQNSWSNISCREAYHIPCVPGHPRCFPLHALCVYDLDHRGNVKYCRNGAHLAQCTYIGCPYKFKCPQSYCIPLTSLCNKVNDCPYGEDEDKCDYSSPILCPGMFYCRGGSCVHQLQVCDGERDCPNGDDENNCDRKIPPAICKPEGELLRCTVSDEYPIIDLFKYRALIITGSAHKLDNLYNYTDLVMLNISGNSFTELKSYLFLGYTMLHILDLSFNDITTLPENTFAGLHSLSRIFLIGNNLNEISPMALNGLTAVEHLDLSHMRLSEIQLQFFDVMTNLKSLDMSGNRLRILNASLYSRETLLIVNVTDNPLEYFYPPVFDLQSSLTLISNLPYLCCFHSILNCCGSTNEVSTCINLLTDIVSSVSIVYGLFVMTLNCLTAIILYNKMSSKQRRKDAATLCVISMDGIIGVYLVVVGLSKYISTIGLVQKLHDVRHVSCLFGAWLQQFLFLSADAIKAKQAFDYMKHIGSRQMVIGATTACSQIRWFILNILSSMSLTGFVILFPLVFEKNLAEAYPICSILLVNHATGSRVQYVPLAVLGANVLLGTLTIVFIIRIWHTIKLTRKAVERLGTVVKSKKRSSHLAPGMRMIIRSSVSLFANIFGISIYLFVDVSTMGNVVIPLLVTLIFNSPSFVSPLTYIVTLSAT